MASVDVSVRGAGIFGLSVAWACVKAGARVELVDPNGFGSGASGGIVGALAPHVPENWNPKKQFQLESLLMARAFWPEVAEISGQNPRYARTGRVQPLPDSAAIALAQSRALGAQTLWREAATWTVSADSGGWNVASGSGQFVQDTLSAHLHPRQACAALAEALRSKSVTLKSEPDTSQAKTIWCTGAAGLEHLSQEIGRSTGQGIKGQSAALKLDRAGLPQLFTDTLHIIPHLDGTVAIGSTTERDFDMATDTDAQLDDLLARARNAVPELADAPVIERWAGLRPRARSRAPMLGMWPGKPDHYIANGGFKIGFGMAPKIGQVMADLVLEGRNDIPQGFDVTNNL